MENTLTTLSLRDWLADCVASFPELEGERFLERAKELELKNTNRSSLYKQLIMEALNCLSMEEPQWTFVAARLYIKQLYEEVQENKGFGEKQPYSNLYGLIEHLVDLKIYHRDLLSSYSAHEIKEAEKWIVPERDELFTYIGLKTLADRYLAKGFNHELYELPQERWMVIALFLMKNEDQKHRMELVKEAYWALSNQYMTVATPTLANAGKSYGQLSSCFIDTVDDSLRGIFDSNTDAATVSKGGGGLGVYLGKIRSRGSDIRGFKGNSSGVIPWMKQLNNTAVSVDQLGQRQGAIAVYLDVWHKDIFEFLDAKLNNGDERMRTHDLFTGVCIPDVFMEKVERREDWYLFDPHEVRRYKGYSLEDFYDEEKGNGSFRTRYEECISDERLSKQCVPAIEIMKRIMKSQLETGTPFMFYRDTVNRLNPNPHKGMVYASNLCTEIMQNMSATTVKSEETEDGEIIIRKTPGDYVVCNLSSLSLARVVGDQVLKRVIDIQVRMLDNVIDHNSIDVPQAVLTNKKYRAIGVGTFGWHHLLAKEGVKWESEEAVAYADKLYEEINYHVINASSDLAKEKGKYAAFEGSDWDSGDYFTKRDYDSEKWKHLIEKVKDQGIRNGYLIAVAPNSSTSIIANSTPSVDPIFKKFYSEEKKNYKIPVTAPDLNAETAWFYKSAFHIDQRWSILQNAARQRHVDQSISFNLYVTHDIKAKDLLDLHLLSFEKGLKTTYYTRSTSIELEGCESCES
ncbi:ribonucleoside-diphosphate reductase subunit alpha [Fictibacillus phosphorivorans]|uniref:ribonucleoside-diphosphate reductase subunit alpha n=1 Tax=Fictibacillus phosphorivorans TaxID=1221500 RepID=UPI00203C9203|nr:ribonucleoside-diphosphate reductase subunit alpha [Fictibacillus phosphorivorans]MCM3716895.1 ribonucleoside-diphosphate reductase subunit alpha [Fictibacillus phosphorivorans]MCM3774556.1 ribonucleoside-diphosphate reductase subunit alpha [Fictibacillus phosphorivorans]